MNLDAVKTDILTQTQHADLSSSAKVKMTRLPRMNNSRVNEAQIKELSRNSQKISQNSDLTDKAISDIEEISRMMNKKIKFTMDYENSEMVVRIVNKETSELIRQIPAEDLIKLHTKLQETAEIMGLIVDEQA